MKKMIIVIILVAILIWGFLVLSKKSRVGQKAQEINQEDQQINRSQNWESRVDDQGFVSITVTPMDISFDSKEWKFNISLSTHSVELDQDLTKVAVLIDDEGNEHTPISWEGDPAEGHHREGTLTFNQILPFPKLINLKISSISDIERSFIW